MNFHSFLTAWVVGFIFYSRFSAFTFLNVYKNWTGCVLGISLPVSLHWPDSYVRTGKELTARKSGIRLFLVQEGLEQSLVKTKKMKIKIKQTGGNCMESEAFAHAVLSMATTFDWPKVPAPNPYLQAFLQTTCYWCDSFKFLKLSVTTSIDL